MIDFTDRRKLKEWLKAAYDLGLLPSGSGAYQADGLDERSDSGVTPTNSYLIRCIGERPAERALMEVPTRSGEEV